MSKRSKACSFTPKAAAEIWQRENYECFFCQRYYQMPESKDELGLQIADIMHVVPRSAGGLGIARNGILGCRYHHQILDNGSQGLREEMMDMIKDYLRQKYPGWNEEEVTYNKWSME